MSKNSDTQTPLIIELQRGEGEGDTFLMSLSHDQTGALYDIAYEQCVPLSHKISPNSLQTIAELHQIPVNHDDDILDEFERWNQNRIKAIPQKYKDRFEGKILSEKHIDRCFEEATGQNKVHLEEFIDAFRALFYDVNNDLQNPVGDSAEDEPIELAYGTKEEFINILDLVSFIAHTYGYKDSFEVEWGLECTGDPGFHSEADPHIVPLLDEILGKFDPTGGEAHYSDSNDGRTTENYLSAMRYHASRQNVEQNPHFFESSREAIDPYSTLHTQILHHEIDLNIFEEVFPKKENKTKETSSQ